jgi:hypothetical protein
MEHRYMHIIECAGGKTQNFAQRLISSTMDEMMSRFKTRFGTTFHPGCHWETQKFNLNRKTNRRPPPHPILRPTFPAGSVIVPSQNYNHLNPGAWYDHQQCHSNQFPPSQEVLYLAAIYPSLSSTSVISPSTVATTPTTPAVHFERVLDVTNPNHSPPSSGNRGTAFTPNLSILN